MRMQTAALALGVSLGLCGCASPPAEGCLATIGAPGKETKISHPREPSTCNFPTMSCNACVYDADGMLLRAESETCGVCLKGSF